jgi:CHASE3 domain sensor protein
MKTRKIFFCLPALLLFFSLRGSSEGVTANPSALDLPSRAAIVNMSEAQKQVLIQQMKDRVDEIKTMDKSQLTKEEKKELRTELKAMKKEARAVTGVYISVGALIIIILLLIIIL